MRNSIIIIAIIGILCAGNVYGASQICSQTFESSSWVNDFTGSGDWGGHICRVSSNAHGGSYAIRGNQKGGTNDPILQSSSPDYTPDSCSPGTGITNQLLDFRGGGVSHNCIQNAYSTDNKMYIKYWFRHDNYTFSGSEGGDGKFFYWIHDVASFASCGTTSTFFMGHQYGDSDPLAIVFNNGCASVDDSWATTHWGYSDLNLTNANVNPPFTDGQWHSFEMLHDKAGNYFMFWVDGYLLVPNHNTYRATFSDWATGKVYYSHNDHQSSYHNIYQMQGIQFFYVHSDQTATSTDGTGYAAGFQLDDIEVWDGTPTGGATPPTSAKGCAISGGTIR